MKLLRHIGALMVSETYWYICRRTGTDGVSDYAALFPDRWVDYMQLLYGEPYYLTTYWLRWPVKRLFVPAAYGVMRVAVYIVGLWGFYNGDKKEKG